MKHIYKLSFSDRQKTKHTLFVAENKIEALAQANNCQTELNKAIRKADQIAPTPVSVKLILNNISVKLSIASLNENTLFHRDVMQLYSNLYAALALVDNALLSEFFDHNPNIEDLI